MKRIITTLLLTALFTQAQVMVLHLANGGTQEYNTSQIDSITFTGTNGSLKWLGHASFKLKTADGLVIYIDPNAGSDYSEAADLVLITHNHGDHNKRSLLTVKDETRIIAAPPAATGNDIALGAGDSLDIAGVRIWAVEAYNQNHPKGTGVGFVLDLNGIKIYHCGDTSKINEMAALAAMHIDYALLCIDGVYNMGPAEAMEAAALIQAVHVIPMHSGFNATQTQNNIDAFTPAGRMILQEGEEINF